MKSIFVFGILCVMISFPVISVIVGNLPQSEARKDSSPIDIDSSSIQTIRRLVIRLLLELVQKKSTEAEVSGKSSIDSTLKVPTNQSVSGSEVVVFDSKAAEEFRSAKAAQAEEEAEEEMAEIEQSEPQAIADVEAARARAAKVRNSKPT